MVFLVKERIDQVMSVDQVQGWRGESPKEGEAKGEELWRGAGAGWDMAAPEDVIYVKSDLLKGG